MRNSLRVPADALNGYKWELYNLTDDPTQTNDLASREPGRLRRMQEIWMMEATRFQVLPISNSVIANMIIPRPGPARSQALRLHRAHDFDPSQRRSGDT